MIDNEQFGINKDLLELSKKTLGSYINKSTKDVHSIGRSRGLANRDKDHTGMKIMDRLKKNRLTGVKTAVKKITKEETVNELSTDTLKSYKDKATGNRGFHASRARGKRAVASTQDSRVTGKKSTGASKHDKIVSKRDSGLKNVNKRLDKAKNERMAGLMNTALQQFSR